MHLTPRRARLLPPPHNSTLCSELPELQFGAACPQRCGCTSRPFISLLCCWRGSGSSRAAPRRQLLLRLAKQKAKAGKHKVSAHAEQQIAKRSNWQLRCYFLHPDIWLAGEKVSNLGGSRLPGAPLNREQHRGPGTAPAVMPRHQLPSKMSSCPGNAACAGFRQAFNVTET